ncbi:hypothetical protein B5X24_HaOG213985 [Helicoverpa armigera]|nr:hypothetical protein B5X24_HaOG213985 [Helicoverpa armigera]
MDLVVDLDVIEDPLTVVAMAIVQSDTENTGPIMDLKVEDVGLRTVAAMSIARQDTKETMDLSIIDVDQKTATMDLVVAMDLHTMAVKTTARQDMDRIIIRADPLNTDILDLIVGALDLLDATVVDHQNAIALDLQVVDTDQVRMDPGLDTAPKAIASEDMVLLISLGEVHGRVRGASIIIGLVLDAMVLADQDLAQDHVPTIFLKDDPQEMLTVKSAAKMNLAAQRIRANVDVMEEERKMDLVARGIRSKILVVILCLCKESFWKVLQGHNLFEVKT